MKVDDLVQETDRMLHHLKMQIHVLENEHMRRYQRGQRDAAQKIVDGAASLSTDIAMKDALAIVDSTGPVEDDILKTINDQIIRCKDYTRRLRQARRVFVIAWNALDPTQADPSKKRESIKLKSADALEKLNLQVRADNTLLLRDYSAKTKPKKRRVV